MVKKDIQKLPELTSLSGIAIFLVVLIHAFSSTLSNVYCESMYVNTPTLFCILSYFMAPAVPIFIFMSGYKFALRDSETPYCAFLKKRLPRVLMSFLIINSIFWLINSVQYYDLTDVALLAKTYFSSWMGYTVAYPLWYIPMYCFVIVICPLLRKAIPNNLLRFIFWLCIALTQKILAVYIPIMATKPIMFLAYPVFFEMGIWAHDANWKRMSCPNVFWLIYVVIGIVISIAVDNEVAYDFVKYTYFCLFGVPLMYLLVIKMKPNSLFDYLGTYSYPIFLFHEPMIGQYTGKLLLRIGIDTAVAYCLLWFATTLSVTILFIKLIERTTLYRVVCNYSIR